MSTGSNFQSGGDRRADAGGVKRVAVLLSVVLLAVLASLPLAACGESSNDGASAGATITESAPIAAATAVPPTATPVVAASPGCAKPLAADLATGKTTARKLTSGGLERSYELHVPAPYNPAKPVPLVLNFHGRSGTGLEQETYSGLIPLSDKDGFILVSPDGIGKTWLAAGSDDPTFTRDLVGRLGGELCVDTLRIFATGISMGGLLSSQLACLAGDLLAAVAPVAGVFFPAAQCKGPGTVPILEFHGTEDRTLPFEGGPTLPSVMASMGKWAAQNGCQPQAAEQSVSAHVKKLVYPGCKADTLHYVVDGGGHSWPGYAGTVPERVAATLGFHTLEISAADLIWAFFKEHPKK